MRLAALFSSQRSLLGLLGLFVVLAAVGCGSDNTLDVTGNVTFDGQPLDEGRILFRMVEGDKKAYSAPISKGAYTLKCEPGPVTVEVTASRIVPGKFDYSNGTPEPVGVMYIPAKYNSKTTLKAEVSRSNRTLSFDLQSK